MKNNFQYILDANHLIHNFFSKEINFDDLNRISLIRTEAFKLQAFGRVIKSSVKKSKAETNKQLLELKTMGSKLKVSAKFIEDELGAYVHHFEMKYVSQDPQKMKSAKYTLFENINNILSASESINYSYHKISQFHLQKKYLKGVRRELKKLNIKLSTLDPTLLEDGTHELRRVIRWAVMYFIYPQNLFSYKNLDAKATKYTQLNGHTGPIKISFENIKVLSDYIHKLGELKDSGLSKNYNLSEEHINKSNVETIAFTNEVINKLLARETLLKLREEISYT